MDEMDDEIMSMFVEDTREHLADIETALMDMERGGADIDEELVNKVFRAAHSIKGGASFLNLNNIRDLAHKLENILHMVRSREMVPDTRVINRLLAGFDRLLGLVENTATSDAEDISSMLDTLSGLATENMPDEARGEAVSSVPIALPNGEVLFAEDVLSLRQALSGGKNLYLVEYDLIHDVQARGKTPLDVINTMESSGLIVDCRMELAAVGDLDAPPVNRIPFYVLFASIVEPDIVGYLFALDASRIHPVDVSALLATPEASPAQGAVPEVAGTCQSFGPFELHVAAGDALLALSPGAAPEAAAARDALLAALSHGLGVSMAWNDLREADVALLQVLVAAGRSFAARGLSLVHRDGVPEAVSKAAGRAGITPQSLAAAGLSPALLLAS